MLFSLVAAIAEATVKMNNDKDNNDKKYFFFLLSLGETESNSLNMKP